MLRIIAWHEFLFTIKRKSWYLVTLGMPLILLAYMGMLMLIFGLSVPGEIDKINQPVGLIDQSGILIGEGGPLAAVVNGELHEFELDAGDDLAELAGSVDLQSVASMIPTRKILKLADITAAKVALEGEDVRQVILIPENYMSDGKYETYVAESDLFSTISAGWLTGVIRDEILRKSELDKDSVDRLQNFSSTTEYEIGETGEFEEVDKLAKGFSLGIPLAVAGLLVLALMMNSGQLLTSLAEEKENKVVEIIISSVSPDSLLFGKVIGIVCAGLLQIAVWMLMVSIIPSLSMLALGETIDYELRLLPLVYSCILMILGFIFYGSLLTGLGSLGSTFKDCQQLSVAPMLMACIPLMCPMVFLLSPDGVLARVLSCIPFFTPIAMTLRLGVYDVPLWELGVAVGILLISIFVAIKFSARLFRVGVLLQGKKPGLGMIWSVVTGQV